MDRNWEPASLPACRDVGAETRRQGCRRSQYGDVFMVPMHARKRKEAFHEPDWSAELQFRAMGNVRAKLELRAPAVAVHGPNARPKLEVETPMKLPKDLGRTKMGTSIFGMFSSSRWKAGEGEVHANTTTR